MPMPRLVLESWEPSLYFVFHENLRLGVRQLRFGWKQFRSQSVHVELAGAAMNLEDLSVALEDSSEFDLISQLPRLRSLEIQRQGALVSAEINEWNLVNLPRSLVSLSLSLENITSWTWISRLPHLMSLGLDCLYVPSLDLRAIQDTLPRQLTSLALHGLNHPIRRRTTPTGPPAVPPAASRESTWISRAPSSRSPPSRFTPSSGGGPTGTPR